VVCIVFAFLVAANCVYGEVNNTVVGEGGEGNATTPANAFAVEGKGNETAAANTTTGGGDDGKALNTFGDYLKRVSGTVGGEGGNETHVSGPLPLLPRFQSFGDYLVEIAHNASLPGAEGGGASGGSAAPPLLPRFQSFGDYLVEIAHGGAEGGKAEGGAEGGGGVEEPPEAGAPTWAPKCDPAKKAGPEPAPVDAKDAPEKCTDIHPLCPFWETRGWCKKGPAYMKKNCQGACDASCAKKFVKFAGDYKCEDKRPDCKEREAAGQCDSSPFFMIWQCSESCKFCAKGDSFTYEYTTAEFTCRKE